MIPRSWLFVPGDSEKKLAKGASTGADALILDLEDSVAAARRPVGRDMTREYLENADRSKCQLYVRINPLDSDDALKDLAGVVPGRPDGLLLPKAESVDDSHRLDHYLSALEVAYGIEPGAIRIFALATETPGAMLTLEGYRNPNRRLAQLSWGAEDLSAAVGATTNRDETGALSSPYILARSLCLMAAHAAGVQAVDTVHPDFRDDAGLKEHSGYARRDGFFAKSRSIRIRSRSSTTRSRRANRRSNTRAPSSICSPRTRMRARSASTARCSTSRTSRRAERVLAMAAQAGT